MRLLTKLRRSEFVGFVHGKLFLFWSWFSGLFQIKDDIEIQKKMLAARNEDHNRVAQAVRDFIVMRPNLTPERYGIPSERYDYTAYFLAVDRVRMLLETYSRHELKTQASVFILRANGAICAASGAELIPATSTQREVSRFISEAYLPAPEEMTRNLDKAWQRKRERIEGVGLAHAEAFLRWMQAALRVKPYLMKNFRVAAMAPGGNNITLVELPPATTASDDPLVYWNN